MKKKFIDSIVKIYKKKKIINNNFRSFYLTFASGILLVSFLSALPFISNYTSNLIFNSKLIDNKSKINFEKTLLGKDIEKNKILEGDGLILRNLFDDIFNFEDTPSDVVRLKASTVEQLFEDTNYDLKDIRKNKIVKPINLNLLPEEIKNIQSTKRKKELFIKIVLPLILEENKKIKIERKTLFSILNKNSNSEEERNWLKSKFKQYGVVNRDLTTLKIRMDEIPVSLAIAQAAKETGWGTSRFAQQGNALFGQWTYDGEGIKPAGSDAGETHKVMRFKILKASVRAYQRNLNTHKSYKKFRKVRAIQRDVYGSLNSLELANYLDKYAETGAEYTKILKKIIEQNNLIDFDDAKILPSSQREKSLI